MKVILIRHPQTVANEKKIIYGALDYPYTERGEQQFEYVCNYLKEIGNRDGNDKQVSVLFSSPSLRTSRLADGIGQVLGLNNQVDSNLAEMNFGIFEGLTMQEAQEKFPDAYHNFRYNFDTTTIPEGEAYPEFISRINDFLIKNISDNEDLLLIIVTHGAVVREILERLLELTPGDSWKFVVGNGCIIELERRNGPFKMKGLYANPF